jgi:hypothetical protein
MAVMDIMNARERFHSIMQYKDVDRIPLWSVEAVTEGAIRRWIKEGDYPVGMSLSDVFKLDPHEIIRLDTEPLPAFVSRTVAEDERWRITTDKFGFTVKTLKEQSVGPKIYYYIDGVGKDRKDWEALKKRYDPTDPRRVPRAWGPELIDHYNNSAGPVALRIDWGPGRGVKNGYTLGLERFLAVLVEDPDLIRDMLEFWADFVVKLARDFVTQCRIDYAFFAEDGIGYRNSSLVSPKMYREIWMPPMRKVVDFLQSHGINLIAHYSSGNLLPLIPVLLEIGVNMSFPLEAAAGMDAPDLRRRFGREFRMIGNVSRQSLMDGPEAVEKEFHAKVLPMMEEGGYIPAVDDAIMPDISFASYQRYVELVGEYRF